MHINLVGEILGVNNRNVRKWIRRYKHAREHAPPSRSWWKCIILRNEEGNMESDFTCVLTLNQTQVHWARESLWEPWSTSFSVSENIVRFDTKDYVGEKIAESSDIVEWLINRLTGSTSKRIGGCYCYKRGTTRCRTAQRLLSRNVYSLMFLFVAIFRFITWMSAHSTRGQFSLHCAETPYAFVSYLIHQVTCETATTDNRIYACQFSLRVFDPTTVFTKYLQVIF